MKRILLSIACFSIFFLLLSGCDFGSSSSSSTPPCEAPTVDLTGTWSGNNLSYTEGSFTDTCTLDLDLTQTESSVTGTSDGYCPNASIGEQYSHANVTGTVCGNSFTGNAHDTGDNTDSAITATISGNSMTIDFSGSDGSSSWTGSGTVER